MRALLVLGHVRSSTDQRTCARSPVALQVPLLLPALASAAIAFEAAKCAILVWCLAEIVCVKTPITWPTWPKPPPLPPPPPPSTPPASSLFSTLQLCAVQDDMSYLKGSFSAKMVQRAAAQQPVIYVGTTYCERSMHGCSRTAGNA